MLKKIVKWWDKYGMALVFALTAGTAAIAFGVGIGHLASGK